MVISPRSASAPPQASISPVPIPIATFTAGHTRAPRLKARLARST